MSNDKITVNLTSDEFLLLCEVLNSVKMPTAEKEAQREALKNDLTKGLSNKFFANLKKELKK